MYVKTLFIVALVITLCGCDAIEDFLSPQPGDFVLEDEGIVGAWDVETIDGQTVQMAVPGFETLTDYFHVWTFYPNGQFERSWGWTPGPNEEGVVIAPPVYFTITGLYMLDGDRLTMQVSSSTFFGDIPGTDTGTWERDDDTLALTFDGGTVIVLKAKI